MRECDVIKPLLALRVEDWSAAERAEVESHLEQCEACATLRAEYSEQDRLIQSLPSVSLTADQRASVWSRISDQESQARGMIFMGLNVVSALSTTVALAVLTVNFLFATVVANGGEDISAVIVPTPAAADVAVREATPTSDVMMPETEHLQPQPEPAPCPELQRRSSADEGEWDRSAVYPMIPDEKELV